MILRPFRSRKLLLFAVGAVAVLLVILAAFPLFWLKPAMEKRLSRQTGGTVSIASLEREQLFSFSPVLRIENIKASQPKWAGPGHLATIGLLRVRLHILPLLRGRVDTDILEARDVRVNLVRDADRRENWQEAKKGDGSGRSGDMAIIRIDNAILTYRDAVQKRSLTLNLHVDPGTGLVAQGNGLIDGAPVRLQAKGATMASGKPWPFTARIDGAAIGMQIAGTMAGPLRTDDMAFRVTAHADDLKRIDRVIEAGLFGTQPVRLNADVTHRQKTWTIAKLTGTVGRSTLAGHMTARKEQDRTKLDGDVRFQRLDFDDLANDGGQAKAAALEAREGPRIVPNTRINIRKIDRTDGRIAVQVDQILPGKRPSAIRTLRAVLRLDNRILTIDPLHIGLTRGSISGRAIVNQRAGQPKPDVTLALALTDSRISTLAGGGQSDIDGRVDGRVKLTGRGDTIRETVGNSDGFIGFAARQGALPTKIAALIGFDIGKGLLGDDEGRSTLRCALLRLNMRKGVGTANPLLIDTGISQSSGSGTIRFPDEAIALTLTGQPKGKATLRLPGPVRIEGTIRAPRLIVPQRTRSVGSIIKALGRAIAGEKAPVATDADCAALMTRTLGS